MACQYNHGIRVGVDALVAGHDQPVSFPHVWGFRPSIGNRPSRFILGIFFGCVAGVAVVIFVVLGSPQRDSAEDAAGAWVWLDAIYAVSYVKLVVTLTMYTP